MIHWFNQNEENSQLAAVILTVLAMAALAGLDLAIAFFAKEWSQRPRLAVFLVGTLTSIGLFWVYAHVLRTAELTVVTFGWVVMLQVGIVVIDRLHYGVALSTGKVAAMVMILFLQSYLIMVSGFGNGK